MPQDAAGSVSSQCPNDCAEAMRMANADVGLMRRIPNPIQRNIGITNAYQSLGDANLTIFESVYPPNRFMNNCGYEKLKECVESGEIDVDPDIMAGLEKINSGDLRGGADLLADHEQRDMVQAVYDRHAETFEDLGTAESWMPGDQTSIPISYECTRDNLVPLGGLNIENPDHRVDYYGLLMDRMMKLEELP